MIDQSFISRYDPFITYCILKYTRPPIEDYKQDIYLILLEHDFHHTHVKAYISKIVKHYFYSIYRNKEKKPKYIPPLTTNSSDNHLLLQDTFKFINKEQGHCLSLYTVGYKYKEIADILDLSMSCVKSRIHELRKRLKPKLTESNEGGKERHKIQTG